MYINVDRGPIEKIVRYNVVCFIRNERKQVCAYLTEKVSNTYTHYWFYVLGMKQYPKYINQRAYPSGPASKLLQNRIASGDTFEYRKKQYTKLTPEEYAPYTGQLYRHIMPFCPENIQTFW